MKPLIVYWAPTSLPDTTTRTNLILEPPTPLRKEFTSTENGKPTNYNACRSLHNFYKNAFVLKHPLSAKWNYETRHENGYIYSHDTNSEDYLRIDIDFGWVFFSEESVEIEQLPAFFHKQKSTDYGYLAAGSFDISKWFRHINPTYILWNGIKEFEVVEDEAMFYIRFLTDRPVILKQFEFTPKINEIALGAANLKRVKPNLTLKENYRRFLRSNRHKVLLKYIKANLIE